MQSFWDDLRTYRATTRFVMDAVLANDLGHVGHRLPERQGNRRIRREVHLFVDDKPIFNLFHFDMAGRAMFGTGATKNARLGIK